jgi:hypothetical protein
MRQSQPGTSRRENKSRSGTFGCVIIHSPVAQVMWDDCMVLPSNGDSGRTYRLLPYEKWAGSHADRFIPRQAVMTPEHLRQSLGPTAFALYIAFRVNLRLFLTIGLTIVAMAVVMIVVIKFNGGPISTDQHPELIASVVTAIVFWPLVLAGVVSLVALYVRNAQWQRERRLFAG